MPNGLAVRTLGGVMEPRSRFKDPLSEVVWRAIEALDPGHQLVLLRELATVHAISAGNPRTEADKIRAAVGALRDVAELLDQLAVSERVPRRPQGLARVGSSARRDSAPPLKDSRNDCLQRALLDAVSDGDFASRPIGVNDRYDDDESFAALRGCGRATSATVPSLTEYLGWAHRPDVRERPGRRPLSYGPFERFGGLRAALAAAGLLSEGEARSASNGRVLPSRYRYHDEDITNALQTVTRLVGRSPRPREYQDQRRRLVD